MANATKKAPKSSKPAAAPKKGIKGIKPKSAPVTAKAPAKPAPAVEKKEVKVEFTPGSTVFKNEEEVQHAEELGIACLAATRKEGKEIIHVASLQIGDWSIDLDMNDAASARDMARSIMRKLDDAVEARVKAALKAHKKAA